MASLWLLREIEVAGVRCSSHLTISNSGRRKSAILPLPASNSDFAGHLFRAMGAVYYAAAEIEVFVVALLASWG